MPRQMQKTEMINMIFAFDRMAEDYNGGTKTKKTKTKPRQIKRTPPSAPTFPGQHMSPPYLRTHYVTVTIRYRGKDEQGLCCVLRELILY